LTTILYISDIFSRDKYLYLAITTITTENLDSHNLQATAWHILSMGQGRNRVCITEMTNWPGSDQVYIIKVRCAPKCTNAFYVYITSGFRVEFPLSDHECTEKQFFALYSYTCIKVGQTFSAIANKNGKEVHVWFTID